MIIVKSQITAVIIFICLCITLFCQTDTVIGMSPDAELTVSSVQGYENDIVTVTVSISDNKGLAGLAFRLGFDNSILEFVEAYGSKTAFVDSIIMDEDVTDYIGFSYAEIEDTTDNGVILTAKFKIKEGAQIGTYPFVLYSQGMNDGEIDAQYTDKEDANKTQSAQISINSGSVEVLCHHEWIEVTEANTENGETDENMSDKSEVTSLSADNTINSQHERSTGYGDIMIFILLIFIVIAVVAVLVSVKRNKNNRD